MQIEEFMNLESVALLGAGGLLVLLLQWILMTASAASDQPAAGENQPIKSDRNEHDLVTEGERVGTLFDQSILDPLKTPDGRQWRFLGRAPFKDGAIDMEKVAPNQCVVYPGLLYEEDE